jgi:hypothetical protein
VWETPFTFAAYPSVGLIVEPDGEGTAALVVAPGGLDAYPKYIVRFAHVFAVTCGEEASFLFELGQQASPQEAVAHIWGGSPHAAGYEQTAFGAGVTVRHYVVFGGDNIASVVAGAAPVIETVSEPREITVRYAV